MKKAGAIVLSLVLLLSGIAALGEDKALEDWVSAYNKEAQKHDAPVFEADQFEPIDDSEYLAIKLDDITAFMLSFSEAGSIYLYAMQAAKGDARIKSVLGSALAALDEGIGYETAGEIVDDILANLRKPGDEYTKFVHNWYFIGAYDDEGSDSVVIGCSFIGISFDDDAFEGSIWEGLEPDGDEPEPEPSPTPTPKPEKGKYKA